jgi:hypothetical protein
MRDFCHSTAQMAKTFHILVSGSGNSERLIKDYDILLSGGSIKVETN